MSIINITTTNAPITRFDTGNNFLSAGLSDRDITISEGSGANNQLTTGEVMLADNLSAPGIIGENATYLGYLEYFGGEYPVFEHASGLIVVGVALPSSTLGTTVRVSVNDVVPFTAFDTVCFAGGTAIATPFGPRPVEALVIGDWIARADGGMARVMWVGRQTLQPWRGGPDRTRLVRIPQGALGNALPARDLCVTAEHGLMLDGLLVNASALVGATGIDWIHLGETATVYHIETEDHAVILAEGVASETFIDYLGRQAFDNYADYVALYGEDRTLAEQPYPRVTSARQLPAGLRARLGLDRAA